MVFDLALVALVAYVAVKTVFAVMRWAMFRAWPLPRGDGAPHENPDRDQ